MQKLLSTLLLGGMVTAAASSYAADPLVFVSAFAAGDDGAIHAYRLNLKTGELKLLHRTTDVEHPFFTALSPDGKFLYSIHAKQFGGKENEQVAAYAIEGRSGRLKLLNRQSAMGTASCFLDVDATGKTVLVANYSTGSVASLPVNKDGSLGESAAFIQHAGSSVDQKRQKGPYAHSIVVSPDNRFAYAADLGIDKILIYRLDPKTSKLAPGSPSFVKTPPGAGPRHLTFHPNGKHLYAINELKNSVTRFDQDAKTGALSIRETVSTLPAEFVGTSYCADLRITPDGKFLYGTNRGHDSIAIYRLAKDGGLKRIGIEPSLGKGPQNLLITPDGGLLLCANMPGNNVVVFRINRKTGALKAVGEPVSVPKPSCIRLLE
ncbi:MAG: lactonase family protein [Verrucomicrobiia bacterium]|jgi:6-phosphogluconolactonase